MNFAWSLGDMFLELILVFIRGFCINFFCTECVFDPPYLSCLQAAIRLGPSELPASA